VTSVGRFVGILSFAFVLFHSASARAQFVVLTPTGQTRDGLPVLQRHPDPAATEAVLTRGFSGHLIRLYALEQEFLRRKAGRAPEPAYLLLSDRQGGFPQFGFYLGDEKKPDAGWVDLHRRSRLSGEFGAMDQIFPHELLHVIVRQLAGEPRESGGNQMHAIGVRTDPVNAFNEGLAEHVQILAVDDPDALPETKVLAGDSALQQRADRAVARYTRDLSRSWWPIQPARMRFLLWYSQTEQAQRYHDVKANLFARTPAIPPSLMAATDKYPAYLLQSVVPGSPSGAIRPASVMLSIDGPVSHLFWRLMTDPALQQRYGDDAFYAEFGTARDRVTPVDNVYLKLFAALYEGRPSTTAETIRAWMHRFPDDAADVERVVHDGLLGQKLPETPEIWLANDALQTGTSLFDQYRGRPRVNTFDANAATTLDWLSVAGVTPSQAESLLAAPPFRDLEAVLVTPVLTPALRDRIRAMAAAMAQLRSRAANEEESLSLWAIMRPYLWRLGALVLVATGVGAWFARRMGVRRWWTAALLALTASLLAVAFAWIITSPVWYPFAAPVAIGGLPWALWRLARRRGIRASAMALATWAVAALPAVVLTLPL
jgi:hypothetical protein